MCGQLQNATYIFFYVFTYSSQLFYISGGGRVRRLLAGDAGRVPPLRVSLRGGGGAVGGGVTQTRPLPTARHAEGGATFTFHAYFLRKYDRQLNITEMNSAPYTFKGPSKCFENFKYLILPSIHLTSTKIVYIDLNCIISAPEK